MLTGNRIILDHIATLWSLNLFCLSDDMSMSDVLIVSTDSISSKYFYKQNIPTQNQVSYEQHPLYQL
jgi:hypothetical protein